MFDCSLFFSMFQNMRTLLGQGVLDTLYFLRFFVSFLFSFAKTNGKSVLQSHILQF